MIVDITGVQISAISAAVPQKLMTIPERTQGRVSEKDAKRLAKGTGFEMLRVCDIETTTSDLCMAAAEQIFRQTSIPKEEVDGLIFVSQTADYDIPSTSHIMQYKLGLGTHIVAMDVSQGCSGFVYGLYLAAALVNAGKCRHVLVCTGDVSTHLTDDEDRSTTTIFGDGGTASIVSKGQESLSFNFNTYGEGSAAIIIENSGYRKSGDGKKGYLQLDGMAIMNFTLDQVPANIEQLLRHLQLENQAIDLYACHQANKLILASLASRLGVDTSLLPFTAARIGNTSSASIPLFLTGDYYNGAERPSLDKVIICAFGVGLSVGTVLANLSRTQILRQVEV